MRKYQDLRLERIEKMLNLLCEALLDEADPNCNHPRTVFTVDSFTPRAFEAFFCPKCGEKL